MIKPSVVVVLLLSIFRNDENLKNTSFSKKVILHIDEKYICIYINKMLVTTLISINFTMWIRVLKSTWGPPTTSKIDKGVILSKALRMK